MRVCPRCITDLGEADECPTCEANAEEVREHGAARGDYTEVAAALKAWRDQQAGLQRMERYRVVPNRALAHLAALQPETVEGLEEAPGIGPAKAKDYGYVLTRYFRERHAGAEPEMPLLLSSPIPDGLDEEAIELLFAVRTLEGTVEAMAARRGLSRDALLDRLETLVAAGSADVVHILCSPLEVHLVAEHVRAHGNERGQLDEALSSTSELARRLVPVAVRAEALRGETEPAEREGPA